MRDVRSGEHGRSCRNSLRGQAMVHVTGGQQAKAGVMVLGVVPGEEDVTVGPGILKRV